MIACTAVQPKALMSSRVQIRPARTQLVKAMPKTHRAARVVTTAGFSTNASDAAVRASYLVGAASMALIAVNNAWAVFGTAPAILANAAGAACGGVGPVAVGVLWKYLGSNISDTNYQVLKYVTLGTLIGPIGAAIKTVAANSGKLFEYTAVALTLAYAYAGVVTLAGFLKD